MIFFPSIHLYPSTAWQFSLLELIEGNILFRSFQITKLKPFSQLTWIFFSYPSFDTMKWYPRASAPPRQPDWWHKFTHKHTFTRGMQPYMHPTGTKPFNSSSVLLLLTFFLSLHWYVHTSPLKTHSFMSAFIFEIYALCLNFSTDISTWIFLTLWEPPLLY